MAIEIKYLLTYYGANVATKSDVISLDFDVTRFLMNFLGHRALTSQTIVDTTLAVCYLAK